jgi:DNA invertase Pin-like site-specific DNA recombinase
MQNAATQKVTPRHLRRIAYLYVRQSSLRQVVENSESTERQYALRQRAIALGWPAERVVVIDSDLGESGASSQGREGFQELVTEVGMGRAGIVMGLEVSRLARNSTDWHRLLEMCALADTLILDEDGIYDPAHFNDRLLLGLKGTMSEAELHIIKARLQGGILNKARKGELECPIPVGFVYDPQGRVVLDPNKQVQETFHFFFKTFRQTGSATATVKAFRRSGTPFPRRGKDRRGMADIIWDQLGHSRALQVLHNPRYAGAFFFGRSRQRRLPDGRHVSELLPREEWVALVRDAHKGYISWEQFEVNLRTLKENAASHGSDRRHGPPREGPALLQGIVICGRCGRRMTVRYHRRKERLFPQYECSKDAVENGQPVCQIVPGEVLDETVGELLVETLSPAALDVALKVQEELQGREEHVDRLRRQHVERARYEADLSRRRYMQVDPENRLVADALEAEWNQKLRSLTEAQEQYERQLKSDRALLSEEKKTQIRNLASDFPRLWQNEATPQRERKRMVRLLIEDVTLLRGKEITAHVRFRGGTTKTLRTPLPLPFWKLHQTDPAVVAEVDRLIDDHTDKEIAAILNERGYRSGDRKPLQRRTVMVIRKAYHLKSKYDRLRERGLLTPTEVAGTLGISKATLYIWARRGLLSGVVYDDRGARLFDLHGVHAPRKHQGRKIEDRIHELKNQADRQDKE